MQRQVNQAPPVRPPADKPAAARQTTSDVLARFETMGTGRTPTVRDPSLVVRCCARRRTSPIAARCGWALMTQPTEAAGQPRSMNEQCSPSNQVVTANRTAGM